jgi:hypothetical protein
MARSDLAQQKIKEKSRMSMAFCDESKQNFMLME